MQIGLDGENFLDRQGSALSILVVVRKGRSLLQVGRAERRAGGAARHLAGCSFGGFGEND